MTHHLMTMFPKNTLMVMIVKRVKILKMILVIVMKSLMLVKMMRKKVDLVILKVAQLTQMKMKIVQAHHLIHIQILRASQWTQNQNKLLLNIQR
jgi:hypothetical protein